MVVSNSDPESLQRNRFIILRVRKLKECLETDLKCSFIFQTTINKNSWILKMDTDAALMHESMRSHWSNVEPLLNKRAGLVNYVWRGDTPLSYMIKVCLEGNASTEKVAYLLSRGADPNKKTYHNFSLTPPLMLCFTTNRPEVKELAEMLLYHGADLYSYLLQDAATYWLSSESESAESFLYLGDLFAAKTRGRDFNSCAWKTLGLLIPSKKAWAVKAVHKLLSMGAKIDVGYPTAVGMARYFVGHATSKLVLKTEKVIRFVKTLTREDFVRAVHYNDLLWVPAAQWKHHALNFDEVVAQIQADERNALVLRHHESTTSVLPDDVLSKIAGYLFTKMGAKRAQLW
jgi:hypothetical protein